MQNVSGYIVSTLKYIFIILIIAVYSCAEKTGKHIGNLELIKLTNKIVPLANYVDNADSCRRAIEILDSATAIDSNCYLFYQNKLMFLNSIKLYSQAVIAVNNCIRLRPDAHDLYLTGGMFYEKAGDAISAHNYFQKSLGICNTVLDTMNISNSNYEMLASNKAINLIMLGKSKEANDLLLQLANGQTDVEKKRNILAYIDKNRNQVIEDMTK